MTRMGLIAVAAMLVGSIGVAGAQTTTTSPSSSTSTAGKCWDSATNEVRDKPALTGSGSTASDSTTSGTTSSTGSSLGGSTSSPGAGGASESTTAARPVGMPNC